MEIMATTTTNNHNQKELRLYAPNEQQQQTANATALASGARSPFQREVREWQRIDPDTGALLTGRLEADRWINGPLNKYGKISDSQNISQPNGTQQTQRKQLEVLQTCTPTGGAMQVIRSQTVQTTSSRWSTSSASPLLLTANNTSNNTSPITTQMQKNKQKTHTSNDYCSSSSITNSTANANTSPSSFTSPSLLSNGFSNHHHQQHLQQHYKQLEQLRQQHNKLQQFPNSFANGFSHSSGSKSRNRNWPDLTKNMSTLDICDNEHDHGNDYIVEQQSTDDDDDGGDGDGDNNRRRNTRNHNDSLLNYNKHDDDDDHDHNSDHQYLLTKLNNLKNVDLSKRHALTVFPNDTANNYDRHDHNHESHHQREHNHSYGHNNLSRDSSSGSCSGNNNNTNSGNNHNNNQLFLLDTAPSLKLSNLMKSSSSLSNSSNNSTTASQATTVPNTTTTMNTHKTLANNKVSLHAIVGSGSNNHMTTATTTSSTPSPTLTTATQRSSWQQPTLYRQNSNGNATHSHLMNTRVGDNNNGCCSRSGSGGGGGGGVCRSSSVSSCDESRSYAANKTETDLRHLQQQQQQQHHIHHVKQNDRLTPTHLPQHSYQRVDLESFRHYNNNDTNTNNNNNNNNNNINNNDTDDDGLRLSNRHQRRQQIPYETNSLQRSRSISTDDLSTEWDIHGGDSEEPAEWRRVSKLRRSFQSTTQKNESYGSPVTIKRPLDLPASSVSVSRIRAELENGRRLNTVMRNNHVDLAALNSILNGNNDKDIKSPLASKRDTFLTAESLKEIRGKLKKLSDESLYKEDFIISQQNNDTNPEVEHIVNDQTKVKAAYGGRKTPERYRVITKTEENNNKHTTNSLESRVKYKDTNSVDWHTRRKSYGFEKMSPPEKAMLRMDASTDSGLGRSGELQNWSPTSENSNANRTVVHFGDTGGVNKPPVVQRRYRTQKSYEESENSLEEDTAVAKRHSIAVDESQYVRDNARQTTQIRLNGFHEPGSYTKFMQSTESTTTTDRGQQKRVEFSKTEVHFATESGRVNIVETDSKPPPTNNFRRRRSRSSSVGPLQSLVKSATTVSTTATNSSTVAMPVTLFGDDSTKKKTLASTTVAYRAPLVGSPEPSKDNGINVTVTIPAHTESYSFHESSRSSYASTSGVDTTDCDTDEMTSLRGILKNKPAKPKPYVLGENIDKPDDLWGVQLKPVNGNQMKTERVYKSESPTLIATTPQKSVAERIQELGSASTQANGFSTKINVSMGSAIANANNWEDNDLPKSNVMSIKLHSPQAQTVEQPPLKVVPPLAKPRTIKLQESATPKVHTATTVKQTPFKGSLPTKDSLKIVKEARGARQLREHELSYFGVPVSSTSEDEKPKTKYNATTASFRNSPKRSLPLRKLSEESTTSTLMAMETEQQRKQWQLESDKPDLLKHNPIDIKPIDRSSLKKKAQLDEEDEQLYENIANDITPVFKVKAATPPLEQYDRKTDLKRDFEILNEMNQNADQTLKELSDEAALKDRRRRSLQRRNSKPLETIDEKSIAERINDSCIAVKISRSTYASEARKSSRHSTPSPSDAKRISSRERSSSQSSVECCPRARSRSLSSEKEYDVTKSKTARTTHMVKHKTVKPTQSRSSSLDSQRSSHSQYSSGDEPQPRSSNSFRREDRSRTKTKRTTSSTLSSTRDKQREEKTNTRSATSSRHNHNHGDTKRLSSTTPSTTHRERVECKHDNNAVNATTRHHSSSSIGLQRSTAATSSGRRQKDDIRDSQRMKRTSALASGRTTAERHDKQVTRSLRDDERNSSQRSSSHRLERNDKDKEKDKTTRSSKGHSSRSTSHQHHERTSKPEKHTKETKTKSTALATHETNTTSSKNAPAQQHHHQHPSHHNSKERHERQHRSKRDEEQQQAEHVHGLKSAIIKTTTKLRDKSRSKKEKK